MLLSVLLLLINEETSGITTDTNICRLNSSEKIIPIYKFLSQSSLNYHKKTSGDNHNGQFFSKFHFKTATDYYKTKWVLRNLWHETTLGKMSKLSLL